MKFKLDFSKGNEHKTRTINTTPATHSQQVKKVTDDMHRQGFGRNAITRVDDKKK